MNSCNCSSNENSMFSRFLSAITVLQTNIGTSTARLFRNYRGGSGTRWRSAFRRGGDI